MSAASLLSAFPLVMLAVMYSAAMIQARRWAKGRDAAISRFHR